MSVEDVDTGTVHAVDGHEASVSMDGRTHMDDFVTGGGAI